VSTVVPPVDLGALLEYPAAAFLTALKDCVASRAPDSDVARFARGVEGLSIERLQELYVDTFDLDPSCTLDLGWHVYGETYERGAFLARLRADLRKVGIAESQELPDHLPTIIVLLDRLEPARAAELRALVRPALERLHAALDARGNPYAHLLNDVVAAAAAGA
jgi:nitrate reductase delta subunit